MGTITLIAIRGKQQAASRRFSPSLRKERGEIGFAVILLCYVPARQDDSYLLSGCEITVNHWHIATVKAQYEQAELFYGRVCVNGKMSRAGWRS